jgi:peptidoglycan hydrolase-like protein with peptidoglycan-binding domain
MRYPALLAGLGLIALTAAPIVAQPAPPQLAYVQPVPPQTVQAVQDKLRQAGAYNGRIDGIWGTDSQAALERFQQSNQLQVTGQLNQATMATLGLDPGSVMTAPVAAAPPPPPPADRLQTASVRAIQARLRSLGFYNGAVDGVWGQGTAVAIENFQRGRGLQPDGQLGPATVTAMGLAPDALAYR